MIGIIGILILVNSMQIILMSYNNVWKCMVNRIFLCYNCKRLKNNKGEIL